MSKFLIVLITSTIIFVFQFVQSVGFASNADHGAPVLYAISDNALLLCVVLILLVVYLVRLVISWGKSR